MSESRLFVVRVWSRDGFHASVRRVDDEDMRLFDSAFELARYLEMSAVVGADAEPAERPAPRREPSR